MIEARVATLDQALLFLSTFASFVLATALNYALRPSIFEFIVIIPLLFMTVGLPLYVGYMRGAVEGSRISQMGERARGWTYLVFGSGVYAISLAESQFAFEPINSSSDLYVRAILGCVIIVLTLGLLIFTWRFLKWMYKSVEVHSIPLEDKVGIAAAVTGVFFSGLFYELTAATVFGKPIYNAPFVYDEMTSAFVSVGYALVYLFPLIALEFGSHHFLSDGVAVFRKEKATTFKSRSTKPSRWAVHFVNLLILSYSLPGVMLKKAGKFIVVLGLAGAIVVEIGSLLAASASSFGVAIMLIGDIALYTALALHIRATFKSKGVSDLPVP